MLFLDASRFSLDSLILTASRNPDGFPSLTLSRDETLGLVYPRTAVILRIETIDNADPLRLKCSIVERRDCGNWVRPVLFQTRSYFEMQDSPALKEWMADGGLENESWAFFDRIDSSIQVFHKNTVSPCRLSLKTITPARTALIKDTYSKAMIDACTEVQSTQARFPRQPLDEAARVITAALDLPGRPAGFPAFYYTDGNLDLPWEWPLGWAGSIAHVPVRTENNQAAGTGLAMAFDPGLPGAADEQQALSVIKLAEDSVSLNTGMLDRDPSLIAGKRILHLSCHGSCGNNTGTIRLNDNEIDNWPYPAPGAAILHACNTGRSARGIVQSLLDAGTSFVIASPLSLPDTAERPRAASLLIPLLAAGFYQAGWRLFSLLYPDTARWYRAFAPYRPA